LKEKDQHKKSDKEKETENSRYSRSRKIKTNRTIQPHQGRDQEFENCLEKQQENKNKKELQKEHNNSGGSNTQSKRRIMIDSQVSSLLLRLDTPACVVGQTLAMYYEGWWDALYFA